MATASRWHDPPRLRTLEDAGDERHATWLELFFDLVFVVAIAQLADGLAEDPSLRGFLIFAGLFVAVWWAWVGYTFYADRFDTDDPPHRVLMIAGMFAVAVLASVIPDAFHGETASFALAYAGVRAIVVALNARAWWHLPAARPLLNVYIPAFSASIAIFLVSVAVEAPYRYWLWALALIIDLGTPLASQERIRQVPIHASHIPERVGLFTIIVFGESVLARGRRHLGGRAGVSSRPLPRRSASSSPARSGGSTSTTSIRRSSRGRSRRVRSTSTHTSRSSSGLRRWGRASSWRSTPPRKPDSRTRSRGSSAAASPSSWRPSRSSIS